MKWARINDVKKEEKLLYQALMWVIAPYDNRPVDHHLKEILGPEKGLGGDPGWEIERVTDEPEGDYFKIWADPYHSDCEDEESRHDSQSFLNAVRETLLAYAVRYPEREVEVSGILRSYNL